MPSKYIAFADQRRPVVFWNITNRCNLHCEHCYSQSDPHCLTGEELTTTEASGLIDDLASMGVPLIIFTGGEPLLREDLWDLADHAATRGIKTALSTNGTLISADVARKIRKTGSSMQAYRLTGPGRIPTTVSEIHQEHLKEQQSPFANCRKEGVRCGVRVTLTRENSHELGPLVDLALVLGASRFCLYWLVPCGRGCNDYKRLQLGREEVTEALDILYRKAKETAPGRMEFLTVDAPQDCIHLLRSMEHDRSPDLEDAQDLLKSLKGGCSAGDRVANIDPWGNVYPCQFARSPDFFTGTIREQPFTRYGGR